ncbi:MAG: 3-hydroxyacyl-CoA dehydrogenase family protein [Thermodesulfobacteriota bacterium]
MKLEDIKKILIAGAGTMGHGMAQVFAMEGYDVSLFSRTRQTLDRATALLKTSLATFVRGGLITADQIPGIMGHIQMTQSLEEGAKDADIAFETILETKDAKIDMFDKLDKLCPKRTILASNTTALNIFDFVKTGRPDKVLIGHWYTPPQLIPLVDIVKGPETSEESLMLMYNLVKKIGRTPLLMKKFSSGYVVPRMQIATLREIFYLLDNDIVTPQALDDAAKTGLAIRMLVVGLVQRIDFGGLDITSKSINNPYVTSTLTPHTYKPRILEELVKAGHLGVKTGKGFYDYGGRSEAELCEERDIKLMKVLKVFKEIEEGKF